MSAYQTILVQKNYIDNGEETPTKVAQRHAVKQCRFQPCNKSLDAVDENILSMKENKSRFFFLTLSHTF